MNREPSPIYLAITRLGLMLGIIALAFSITRMALELPRGILPNRLTKRAFFLGVLLTVAPILDHFISKERPKRR